MRGPGGSGCAREGAAAGLYAEQRVQAADGSQADSGTDTASTGEPAEGEAAEWAAAVSGEPVLGAAAGGRAGAASLPEVQLFEVSGEQTAQRTVCCTSKHSRNG